MAAGYEDCCLPCVLDQDTTKLCLDVSAPGCEFDGAHVELLPLIHELCSQLWWRGTNRPDIIVGPDCYVDAEVYCGIGEGDVDGVWGVTWSAGLFAFTEDPVSVSVTCDPFQIVFDYGTISVPGACCEGLTTTVSLTFTACGDHWCGDDVSEVWGGSPPPPPGPAPPMEAARQATIRPSVSNLLGRLVAGRNKTPKPRQTPCVFIGTRKERKAGCGGFSCTHECDHGPADPGHAAVERHLAGRRPLTTVPSDHCQTCPGYQADAYRTWT